MSSILLLGLLGIGIGGFYGLLGTGVVVGHKGSGLINLDQGALAMYPAYTYATMRAEGVVYFPWFDFVPGPVDIPYQWTVASSGFSASVSMIAAMLMSLGLGLLLQTLVFGPLRNKPPISKIIGSLGALLYLTGIAQFQFGSRARTVRGVIPDGAWKNPFGLSGQLPYERIVLALTALVVGGLIALYYRRTRMGLATRAVEESEFGASLLGYAPNRVAMVNWLISALITGTAGVLALDFLSITPTRYTLFVVPALGAALVGNLTSPWLAALGGVLLGVFQSAAAGFTFFDWWPTWLPAEGMRQAVPLIVIATAQYVRGTTLPVRSTRFEEKLPSAPIPIHVGRQIGILVAFTAWVLLFGSHVSEGKLVTSLVAAILMLSSVVLIGYLGQLSLAGLAFAGVSGYLATKFASDGTTYLSSPFVLEGPGLPDPLAVLFGVFTAVCAGMVLAVPALRVRGVQLAVVTLAAAVAAPSLILGNEALMGAGARSNVSVPPPSWFGVNVGPQITDEGLTSRTSLLLFCLAWLVLVILGVAGLRRGTLGRQFMAVRSNERAAEAVGVDVMRSKMLGFGISAALAGVAGALLAYHQTVLQVTSWGALSGMNTIALLFLGGVGRISGALLGAALVPGGILASSSGSGEVLQVALSGAAMIALAILRPDGLTSLAEPLAARFRRSPVPVAAPEESPEILT